MKNKAFPIFIISMFLLTGCSSPQKVVSIEDSFTDGAVKEYVEKIIDENGDGYIDDNEIKNTTYISINNEGISDISGLEIFKNVSMLSLKNNDLESIDLSVFPRLEVVFLDENELTDINFNNSVLKNLYLNCNKKLKVLDLSNCTSLEVLDLEGCERFENLDISKNTELQELDVSDTRITYLNLSNNKKLKSLTARNIIFDSVVLPPNTDIEIIQNQNN